MFCLTQLKLGFKIWVKRFPVTIFGHIEKVFYAPGMKFRGHLVFVLSACDSICHSVAKKTLTLAVTFEPQEIHYRDFILACILN